MWNGGALSVMAGRSPGCPCKSLIVQLAHRRGCPGQARARRRAKLVPEAGAIPSQVRVGHDPPARYRTREAGFGEAKCEGARRSRRPHSDVWRLGDAAEGREQPLQCEHLLRETNEPDHSLRTKSRILSLYWIRWLFTRSISALSASYSGNSRWIDCGSMILFVVV